MFFYIQKKIRKTLFMLRSGVAIVAPKAQRRLCLDYTVLKQRFWQHSFNIEYNKKVQRDSLLNTITSGEIFRCPLMLFDQCNSRVRQSSCNQ